MRRGRVSLALCVLALLWLPARPQAAELPAPQGAVVLTITGNIQNTNRPAFDAKKDVLFNYHEKNFTAAAAFDLEMLENLGMHEVEAELDIWPAKVRFEGPRLKDLLAAVGAAGTTINLLALDGYGSEIPWSDTAAYDWIVALKQDGKYLGLGQQGPLWVVYGYPDGRPMTAEDEARWPWAAFFMEIN